MISFLKDVVYDNWGPGPLWLRVVVLGRVPSMGQIELFNHFLYLKPFNYVQTNN